VIVEEVGARIQELGRSAVAGIVIVLVLVLDRFSGQTPLYHMDSVFGDNKSF
jgi:hypothetical protein